MKNKKIKIIYCFGALMAMSFALIASLSFAGLILEIPANASSDLYDFGKYAGTNDVRDGIALSACGSSRITGPEQGKVFDHSQPISFSSEFTPAPLSSWYLYQSYFGPDYVPRYIDYSWRESLRSYYWKDSCVLDGLASSSRSTEKNYSDSVNFTTPGTYSQYLYAVGLPSRKTSYAWNELWPCDVPSQCAAAPEGKFKFFVYDRNDWKCACCKIDFSTGWKIQVGIGQGSGTVTSSSYSYSSPTSLNCYNNTGSCSKVIKNNDALTLIATPSSGYNFSRWNGGPCNGSTSNTCSFSAGGDYTITADFAVPSSPGCTAGCGTPSTCTVSCGGGTQTQSCVRSDCSTYTNTQSCNTQACYIPPASTLNVGGWKEVAP